MSGKKEARFLNHGKFNAPKYFFFSFHGSLHATLVNFQRSWVNIGTARTWSNQTIVWWKCHSDDLAIEASSMEVMPDSRLAIGIEEGYLSRSGCI